MVSVDSQLYDMNAYRSVYANELTKARGELHEHNVDELPNICQSLANEFPIASFFLKKMLPKRTVEYGTFRFLPLEEIESNLDGLEVSPELQKLSLLPFAEFDGDLLCCLDLVQSTILVLRSNAHPIEPFRGSIIRQFLYFPQFFEFMKAHYEELHRGTS